MCFTGIEAAGHQRNAVEGGREGGGLSKGGRAIIEKEN